MLTKIVRGVLCIGFSVLLVLLVPSSAWSATSPAGGIFDGGPTLRALSSLSPEDCAPSSADPDPEPGDPESTPPELEEPTDLAPVECITVTATATVTQTVVEQGEATCGGPGLPACSVALDEGEDPWLLVTAALLVGLVASLLVTTWGQGS